MQNSEVPRSLSGRRWAGLGRGFELPGRDGERERERESESETEARPCVAALSSCSRCRSKLPPNVSPPCACGKVQGGRRKVRTVMLK